MEIVVHDHAAPLVRIVLAEQLYRAWAIMNNHPIIENSLGWLHVTTPNKIVATLGPATSHPDIIEKMILAGMDVARLKFRTALRRAPGTM